VHNGVADKRRPRTGVLLKEQMPIIIKIYLTELLYKATLYGTIKPIITRCQMRKRRPLDWLVILTLLKIEGRTKK